MRSNAVLVVAFFCLALVGCKRPCEKAENCIRSCECLNDVTDNRIECAIGFRCDGKTATCEDAFDGFTCEEICAEYAANARCGVDRCLNDANCVKVLSCPIVDANNQPTGQFFDCTLGFLCEADKGESCEPRSTVDDATLCAVDCQVGIQR